MSGTWAGPERPGMAIAWRMSAELDIELMRSIDLYLVQEYPLRFMLPAYDWVARVKKLIGQTQILTLRVGVYLLICLI